MPVSSLISCHRHPARSFFWRGRQFPVCARCTGLYLGILSAPLFVFHLLQPPFWVGIILLFPALIEAVRARTGRHGGGNLWRAFTGLAAGVGSVMLLVAAGELAVALLLN